MFDAPEHVYGRTKPRLVLDSTTDVRDLEKVPEHYVSPEISRCRTVLAVLYLHI